MARRLGSAVGRMGKFFQSEGSRVGELETGELGIGDWRIGVGVVGNWELVLVG